MAAKVWMVSSGEYSDYMVDAICATEELAYGYAVAHGGDYIQEMELVTEGYIPDPQLYREYSVTVLGGGGIFTNLIIKDPVEHHAPELQPRNPWLPKYDRRKTWHVCARSEEQAQKIIQDLVAQQKAEQEGL